MIGLKLAQVALPFPSGNGIWIRTVINGSNILQGQVLVFNGQEIIDLSSNNNGACGIATPETVLAGDELCTNDGAVVIYTKIEGINMGKASKTPPETQPRIVLP